jgi:hypothetical protein
MRITKQSQAIFVLALFGIAMSGFTGLTVYEYVRFRGAESVQGTVVNVDSYRSGGHRKYRATITAMVGDTLVTERIPVSSGSISIGGLQSSSGSLKENTTVEMLAVPSEKGYDMAVADDVRNPIPELFWETFTLSMIGFCLVAVARRPGDWNGKSS